MKKYINLIKTNKNLRVLVFIQLICYFGAWFSYTGIFTLLISLKAPVWAISLSAAMAFIPSVVLAPFSGVIIDKFKPFPLLVTFMVIESITVLMLLLVKSMDYFWFLQILIFIRMGVGGMYFQVEMSLLPKLLTPGDLKIANEIHSIIWAVSYTAGMGLAGIYIHYFGVSSSFIFDFCLYFIGTCLLFRLNIPKIIENKTNKTFDMIKEGLLYILQNKPLLHLLFIHGIVGATAYDALIALMADYQYKEILSTSLIIGFMNMSRAISLTLGPIILSKFTNDKTLFYLFLGQAAGIFIWAMLQFNFYIGFIGLICAGFCTSTIWSYTYTQIQTACDRHYYGRVVAWLDMIYLGIAACVSISIGILYKNAVSIKLITVFMSSIFLVGAFYYKFIYKKYLS